MNAAGTLPAADPPPAAAAAHSRTGSGLSRRQRVAESHIFREAYDRGPKYVGRLMVLWLRSGEGASLRLGVVASKRAFRRSVDRSRARRLLREAFRLNRYRFGGAFDVIIVARQALFGASRQDAERDLLRLAEKAGLCRRGNGSDENRRRQKTE